VKEMSTEDRSYWWSRRKRTKMPKIWSKGYSGRRKGMQNFKGNNKNLN